MKRFIKAWLERHRVQARVGGDELCPLPLPLPWVEARRVLVFAPHPDDESIGCGGLLALLAQRQVPAKVVLVTDGGGAGGLPAGAAAARQQEFRRALARLGTTEAAELGFVDGALAPGSELDTAIGRELRGFAPDWVLMPALHDLHRDHRVLAQAVLRAATQASGVRALWQYETWSALPVTHVLDITGVLAAKRAAISEHVTALACGNYLEAAIGLASYRALLLGQARAGAAAEAYLSTPLDR